MITEIKHIEMKNEIDQILRLYVVEGDNAEYDCCLDIEDSNGKISDTSFEFNKKDIPSIINMLEEFSE